MTLRSPPAASVIVPTYDDWDELQACVNCLARQDLPAAQFEVIIANNNAEEAVPPALSLAVNVQVVWQNKPGSYAARNAAVKAATGGVLFFTDADCRPTSDWLSTGLELLAQQPLVGRLGGAIELTSTDDRWNTAELYDRIFNLRQDRYVPRGYAATANLVVRREVFDLTGPFDETLFSSGDKEWNRRSAKAGATIVYADGVRVQHAARSTYAAHAKKRARVVQGRYTMKSGRRWTRVSSFKYLLPSIKSVLRIAGTPKLSLSQRLALVAFDYRLRRLEFQTTQALCRGSNATYR